MRVLRLMFVVFTILPFIIGCELLKAASEKIPSMIKVQVVDDADIPYGYVTVSLIDSNGRVAVAGPANERGSLLLKDGIKAGTYTFVVKNATGTELEVIEPTSIKVRPGKTVEVVIKVKRVIAESQFD